MLEVTVDGIKDFQMCALLHKYRYIDGLYEPVHKRDLLVDRYMDTIRKVMSFFFYKKQSGQPPSYNALTNRWEKLWFPKEMDAHDLALEQHEVLWSNYATMSNGMIASFMKFYEDFSQDIGDPLLIDEKFCVPLTKDLKVSGSFDLVLMKKDEYTVIKWLLRPKRQNVNTFLFDMAVTRHAFEYRNDKHQDKKKVKYKFYDIGSTSNGFIDADPIDDDIKAFTYWAEELADTKLFVPRRGLTIACKSCPFDNPCSKFSMTLETQEEDERV